MMLIISRQCSVRSAGIVFFGYSLTMIASTVARVGTELSALRAIAQAHDVSDRDALRTGAFTRVLLVCTVSGVGSLALLLSASRIAESSVGPGAAASLGWAALAIPAFALNGLFSELYKAVGRAWIGLIVQNVATPVFVIPVLFVLGTRDATEASAVICAGAWLAALVALAHWHRKTAPWSAIPRRRAWEGVAALVLDVPTLLVVTATPVVMQWIGAALLGFLTTPTQVAGYSVAARLAIAVSVVHSAASSVSAPRLAVAHSKNDLAALRKVAIQTGLIITGITLPILVGLAAAAPVVLKLFGSTYDDFATPLRILLVGQVIAALIGHSGMILAMTGMYDSARRVSLTAVVSLAVLQTLLVPSQGARGAAISASVSVATGHLAGLVMVHRKIGVWAIPTSVTSLRSAIAADAEPKAPASRARM